MAPRGQPQRRNQPSSQNEHVYALGVVGRKTGVTLHDTGERDEYGMEPADNLFSSPEKENGGKAAANGHEESESDNEQDMEIDEASSPGPATVSRMRNRMSLPKARSPGKTTLNSPARHNPHVGRTSSPIRGSVVEDQHSSPMKSAKRRLDFSKDPKIPAVNGSKSMAKGSSGQRSASQPVRGTNRDSSNESTSSDDEDILPVPIRKVRSFETEQPELDEEEEVDPMEFLDMAGDDMDLGAAEGEDEEEQEDEPVQEERPKPKARGRKPKAQPSEPVEESPEAEPAKKKRGRAPKKVVAEQPKPAAKPAKRPSAEELEPAAKPVKRPRGRPSLTKEPAASEAESSATAEARAPKRQKPEPAPKAKAASSKAPASAPAPVAKGKPGRKRKSSGVGGESPVVKPRPPMPKRRSLVSQRRDDLEVKTTRSGRVSTKPLEYWRGEHYDYEDDDNEYVEDKQGRRIKVGSKIKGVVRVEYDEDETKPKRRRGRPASGAVGRPRKREIEEEEEERDDWEEEPGRITGECILWHPEYALNPPGDDEQVEVVEEELAISESAIKMKDIKDATFRFAKALTLDFFGSGLVDLPPHSEKRMKNTRKMHMAFFIHYGSVEVTVSSSTFRIAKGGMWFVPRGNSYSIVNDTDRPARLFFSQGCEIMVQPGPDSQEM